MGYGNSIEPTYIYLGTATDVKEYPLDPIEYVACENRNCAYNQVIVIDFDNCQKRYYRVCGFTNEDAMKCCSKIERYQSKEKSNE